MRWGKAIVRDGGRQGLAKVRDGSLIAISVDGLIEFGARISFRDLRIASGALKGALGAAGREPEGQVRRPRQWRRAWRGSGVMDGPIDGPQTRFTPRKLDLAPNPEGSHGMDFENFEGHKFSEVTIRRKEGTLGT